jgi:quercetin dioxygenase-like cupin family protein
MKKTTRYAMAILLVPWVSCTNQPVQNLAKQPSTVAGMQADMILPPSKDTILPSGRHNFYLEGLRNQSGFFVERSVFPPGYKGMPHVHNADLYVTIISGSAFIVMNDRFDTTVMVKPYGPGSFLKIPADQPHYEWFTEECTMQIEGIGPNETFFISSQASN